MKENKLVELSMKNKPYITGIVAASSPIPLCIFTILWFWVFSFWFGMRVLGYDIIPDWILICSLLPLAISPTIGLLGLVHSLIKIKTKLSWLGIVLSAFCLLENFLMIFGMYCAGSRF